MARLVYCDLIALTELQMDVLAGEYAADRPREDLGRQPDVPPGAIPLPMLVLRPSAVPGVRAS